MELIDAGFLSIIPLVMSPDILDVQERSGHLQIVSVVPLESISRMGIAEKLSI